MRAIEKMKTRGFTLMELMVAMALGIIVLGSAVGLFTKALNISYLVTQRAEMQQDARAGLGVVVKDISLAGAGLPTGGVQLPSGNGSTPALFGRDATKTYVANNAYPANHLYGAIPNPYGGAILQVGSLATDSITLAYTDTTFLLNDYVVSFPGNTGGRLR